MYSELKLLHIGCAVLSGAGFLLRGVWMLRGDARLQTRWARTLPHVIDTLLLLTALAMLASLGVWPWQLDWLLAKLLALLLYIGLGMAALRRGRTLRVRRWAFVLALITFGYIVVTAVSKDSVALLSWVVGVPESG
jgi:uncharacterized membrane protein SirB2